MTESFFSHRSIKERMVNAGAESIAEQFTRHIGEELWWSLFNLITDKFVEKIIVEDDLRSPYDEFQNIIHKLDPDAFERHAAPTGSKTVKRLNGDSKYHIFKRDLFITVKSKSYYSNNNNKINYTILYLYGKKARKFHNFVLYKLSTANTKDEIAVYRQDGFDIARKENCKKLKVTDTVFKQIVLADILGAVHNWVFSKEFYKNHKIPYKLAILLHGQPGTGKSTMIRLIASLLDSPIIEVNVGSISSLPNAYRIVKAKTDHPIVIVLEDIDFFFQDRDKNGNNQEQHALFQVLDGLHTPDGVIFIATTNFLDKLDSALIRRFDLVVELKYWKKKYAVKYAEMLGFNENDLDQFNIQYPVQPSALKSLLLKKLVLNKI